MDRLIPWSLNIRGGVAACTVGIGGVPWRSWWTLIAAPMMFSFLTASTLLLLEIQPFTWGVNWGDDVFRQTVSFFVRSTAAVMELLFLLPRIGVPKEILDLTAMICRFPAVALKTLKEMRRDQLWRMGLGRTFPGVESPPACRASQSPGGVPMVETSGAAQSIVGISSAAPAAPYFFFGKGCIDRCQTRCFERAAPASS